MAEQTCEERIDKELAFELGEVRRKWTAHQNGTETNEELFREHGFGWWYTSKQAFGGIPEGYFVWCISGGGPSDEFRFFHDARLNVTRIEYWFLNWFDGAHRVLEGQDKELLLEIFEWHRQTSDLRREIRQAEGG